MRLNGRGIMKYRNPKLNKPDKHYRLDSKIYITTTLEGPNLTISNTSTTDGEIAFGVGIHHRYLKVVNVKFVLHQIAQYCAQYQADNNKHLIGYCDQFRIITTIPALKGQRVYLKNIQIYITKRTIKK